MVHWNRIGMAALVALVPVLGTATTGQGQPADCPAPMYGLDPANTGQSRMVGAGGNAEIAWERQVHGDSPYPRSLALSSTGLLYTPGDDLFALRASDGQVVWCPGSGGRDSRAAIDAQGRLFAFEHGRLRARRAGDGAWLWTGAPSAVSDGEPVKIAPDGTVYAPEIRGVIYAYHPGGTLKWQTTTYGVMQYGEAGVIPAIDPAGNLYFAGGTSLISLNPSGTERWSVLHGGQGGSRVVYSPAGDVVWQHAGAVQVRDPATGDLVRTIDPPGVLQAMDGENNLYFTSSRWLAKVNYLGEEVWRYEHNYMDWPLVVDAVGKVYCATQEGDILALSSDGEKLWELSVIDGATPLYSCAPIIGEDGSIYLLAQGKAVAIVPEPATVCLLAGSALILLGGRRRRQGADPPAPAVAVGTPGG